MKERLCRSVHVKCFRWLKGPLIIAVDEFKKGIENSQKKSLVIPRFKSQSAVVEMRAGVRSALNPNFFPWKDIVWFILVTAMLTTLLQDFFE